MNPHIDGASRVRDNHGVSIAWIRALSILGLGFAAGCGGSCGTEIGPVPGGFDSALKIPRAAQVRLTSGGLDVLATSISDGARAALSRSCVQDADCPAGYRDMAGAEILPNCVQGRCQEAGVDGPYAMLPTPSGVQAGLEFCPALASACQASLRFGGATLAPRSGQGLQAIADIQLSADIAITDPSSGASCLVHIRPPASPQSVTADVDLGIHAASQAVTLGVPTSGLTLAASRITVEADPVVGDMASVGLCPQADVSAVQAQLEGLLASGLQSLLTGPLAWTCSRDSQCPSQSTCDLSAGQCVDTSSGHTLFDRLAYDTRLQLPALLGSLGYRGTSGQVDTAVSVGGTVDIDADGLSLGVLAGLEVATPNPNCATITPSPVTRPGFMAPPSFPAGAQADLDFDGSPETDYDVAFGISQDMLQQSAWGIYTAGLLCGVITHDDFSELTSGALSLIIPSIRFLSRSHLFERSEAPARLSVHMRSEPDIVVGTGEVEISGGDQLWKEPLARLDLNDVEINLAILMDERWLRVMTITLDVHIGIGAVVTPNNEIEPQLGVGVLDLVSNVRITNSELLTEPPSSLEASIPTLLSLLILDLSGSQGAIALPSIAGLDLTVLGLKGEAGPGGAMETLAVYADAQPSMSGNLHAALQTELSVINIDIPATEAFSVQNPGGPKLPAVHLRLEGESPEGRSPEFQVRVDGGPWSPFLAGPEHRLEHPAFLLQGQHQIEARGRLRGAYKTLDATPAQVQVLIDSVAPTLEVRRQGPGVFIEAWDRLSSVELFVDTDEGARSLTLDDEGYVALPEFEGNSAAIRAVDVAGNATVVVLIEATPVPRVPAAQSTGCQNVPGQTSMWWLALMAVSLVRRRYFLAKNA